MNDDNKKTDEELAESCKQGDDSSFQELMRRYLKPVFNFARQYTRATEEAEDITQDAFFKAWKHIKKFKSNKKWKTWIFTITRNTALDHIKKKRAIPFSGLDSEQDDVQFSETLEDPGPLATELFENTQNIKELTAAIDILRPEYNSVLMLHYHEELTFEEIAIVMNTPMNTVKSWHRRALEAIRESLASIEVVPR